MLSLFVGNMSLRRLFPPFVIAHLLLKTFLCCRDPLLCHICLFVVVSVILYYVKTYLNNDVAFSILCNCDQVKDSLYGLKYCSMRIM